MSTRTMTLHLDEADYDTIAREIAHRQARDRAIWAKKTILPKSIGGRSSLAGALIAEMIRDLDEYRAIHDREGAK